MARKKKLEMEIVNHNAAGIDVGSRSHYVAVSQALEDVKEFYHEFYGASNASLVIAGDIDVEETKRLVQQWFGEIPSGPEVAPLDPMPVTLAESKSLYFKDNFAKLPELRMVFPTVEDYNEDMYALEVLGNLLSGSRKSPLYKEIVEMEKIITSADFKPMTENVELHACFEKIGDQTKFTFSVIHETEDYCKQQEKMGFYNGWGSAFDRLELLVIKPE